MRRLLLLFALLPIAVPVVSCLDPTQLTVIVTTSDCTGFHATSLWAGPPEALAQADPGKPDITFGGCADGRIGDVVVVPSGGRDARMSILVRGETDKGRIEARRLLGFLPHRSLTITVNLSPKCAGVICDPSLTCLEGACVPPNVDPSTCTGPGCDDTRLDASVVVPPIDASLRDATIDVPTNAFDASKSDAFKWDAVPLTCDNGFPNWDVYLRARWRFEGDVQDEMKIATGADPPMGQFEPGPADCGTGFAPTTTQNLGNVGSATRFAVSVYYKTLKANVTIAAQGATQGKGGWMLQLLAGQLFATITNAAGSSGGGGVGTNKADGAWHRARLSCSGNNCQLDSDGSSALLGLTHGTADDAVVVGTSVDELSLYISQ